MKNLIFSLILGTILVSFLGCDPINLLDPPVEDKLFTVTTICGPNGIIGPSYIELSDVGYETIAIIPDEGYIVDVLKVDGKVVPSTTSFVLYINSDKTVEATFKVKFKEGSLSWLLIQGPWYQDSLILKEDNGNWSHYGLWGVPGEHQIRWIFYPSGKLEVYLDGKQVGDVTWSIDETTNPPTINGKNTTIEKLDKKWLSLGATDNTCRDIYSHH